MNERNITIISVVVLAVVAIGGGVAVWYLWSSLSDKQRERDDLEKIVKAMEDKRAKLPDLRKQKGDVEGRIEAGRRKIPVMDDSQYDELADLIDSLRKQSGTFIDEARYQPGVKGRSGAGTVPPSMFKAIYQINVRGGFFNLLRFLNLLEANERFVGVDTFTIAAGDESQRISGAPARQMRLTVFSFTRKPLQAAEAAPTSKGPEPEKASVSTPLPQ